VPPTPLRRGPPVPITSGVRPDVPPRHRSTLRLGHRGRRVDGSRVSATSHDTPYVNRPPPPLHCRCGQPFPSPQCAMTSAVRREPAARIQRLLGHLVQGLCADEHSSRPLAAQRGSCWSSPERTVLTGADGSELRGLGFTKRSAKALFVEGNDHCYLPLMRLRKRGLRRWITPKSTWLVGQWSCGMWVRSWALSLSGRSWRARKARGAWAGRRAPALAERIARRAPWGAGARRRRSRSPPTRPPFPRADQTPHTMGKRGPRFRVATTSTRAARRRRALAARTRVASRGGRTSATAVTTRPCPHRTRQRASARRLARTSAANRVRLSRA